MRISDWSSDVCSSDLSKIALIGPINRVDQYATFLQPGNGGKRRRIIVQGDDSERCFRLFADALRAGAAEQSCLGLGCLPLAHQNDRTAVQADDERQAVHLPAPNPGRGRPRQKYLWGGVRAQPP